MAGYTVFKVGYGTTAQRSAYTPAQGELIFDTDLTQIFFGDGSTAGGNALGGVSTFVALSDVPSSYSGQALKLLRVNAGETAVEFVTAPYAQNSFETIAVSGESDVVADSSTDTLTLANGTGMTIATNASTDTITFSVAATAVTPGSYGSATQVGTFTVDSTGRLTAASNTSIQSASTSQQGLVELAIGSEVNTGTSTTLAVTPDALAESYAGRKAVGLYVVDAATALATGDGLFYFRIPTTLNGMDLVGVAASVTTASTSGTPTIQIARGRQAAAGTAHAYVDMLSTLITIDANEYDSKDATTAAVINTSNDDVATGDLIRIDCDVAGTSTTGLHVNLIFGLP